MIYLMNIKLPLREVVAAQKNNMRVIAGKYKNHHLEAPKGLNTRPTMDRVKEAMFSILSYELLGCTCLDLFAGSGALGIEAFSRGASYVLLNDFSFQAIQVIKQNINHLKITEGIEVLNLSYEKALNRLHENKKAFDLILLDPPYKMVEISDLINLIIGYSLIKVGGSFMVETSLETVISPISNYRIKEYRYGDKKLTWLKQEPSQDKD